MTLSVATKSVFVINSSELTGNDSKSKGCNHRFIERNGHILMAASKIAFTPISIVDVTNSQFFMLAE